MSRTVTAMFDSRAEAESARERLVQAGVSDVQVHDQSSQGYSSSQYSTHENRGFWAELKSAFLPDEDRHTYEEGVRRGGAVLTAQVDESRADEACRILDNANSVDLDQRTSEWRQSGWDYQPSTLAGSTSERAITGDRSLNNEERIPIVEEELRVGKREVNRGGVRVRSYVVEQPVHEQVALREEHVSVERRRVDQPISATDDVFRERSIEMTETAEEAVIGKEARIREELVVHKDVNERVQEIDDSVRHTEVDVENDAANRAPANDAFQRDYQQAAQEPRTTRRADGTVDPLNDRSRSPE